VILAALFFTQGMIRAFIPTKQPLVVTYDRNLKP
jgi:hypothetical protein